MMNNLLFDEVTILILYYTKILRWIDLVVAH